MDLSKEYIKMCYEAKEIQRLGFEDINDFTDEKYIHSYYVCKGCMSAMSEDNGYYYCSCENYPDANVSIYLPRQDQLLEMIDISKWRISFYRDGSSQFIFNFDQIEKAAFGDKTLISMSYKFEGYNSVEQALLGLYMKDKFNKTWNPQKEVWE